MTSLFTTTDLKIFSSLRVDYNFLDYVFLFRLLALHERVHSLSEWQE